MLKLLLSMTCLSTLAAAMPSYIVETSQGNIAFVDSKTNGPVLFFIHGNSACKEVFAKQYEALANSYRVILVDLPGHGESDRARDESYYSYIGYASVLEEVIQKLNLEDVILVGWSLGGHIALQIAQDMPDKIAGVAITGTPPLSKDLACIGSAFIPNEKSLGLLTYDKEFDEAQARQFLSCNGFDTTQSEAAFFIEKAQKTHGIARRNMINAIFEGRRSDETEFVAQMTMPLAIIQGELDPCVDNTYFAKLVYGSLFKQVYIMPSSQHWPFWDHPEEFNAYIREFVTHALKAEVAV